MRVVEAQNISRYAKFQRAISYRKSNKKRKSKNDMSHLKIYATRE